ncbi:flagellar hook-length control protein FliK [Dasania marina]|uniref:flagellar hook-length control protein FliK n=1 Tax=Dasania marina TaxID=471499 RepID=UPI000375AE1D|nr:flagellar hook-length control protein FliK [Dasania marina]
MSLLSNHLLNSTVTLKSAAVSNSSLFKPGVIEAIVLSNSPLLNNGKAQVEQFQARLQPQANNNNGEAASKPLDIISKLPLTVGSKIQLQINADNSATIIAASSAKNSVISAKPPAANTPNHNSTAPQTTATTSKSAQPVQQLIDTALRLALPQQLALKSLLPLLQHLSLAPESPLPAAISKNIKSLLANIPSPSQAQDPKQLKRALLNSGTFFESKLKRLVIDSSNRSQQHSKLNPEQLAKLPSEQHYQNRDGAIINADSKAKTQQLIRQIEQLIGKPINPANAKNSHTGTQDDSASKLLLELSQLKSPELNASNTAKSSNVSSKDNVDIMLQQLGRQLLATLAKTQLHQLDSLNPRSQSSNEASPNSSWSLELPIMQGKQVDNVEIKINQQDSDKEKNKGKKQWQVMLDFDLHKLGKMSVELIVIDKSVSATVWSELEAAHRVVKKEIDHLRTGLEKIGVNVKKVDCKIGLPKKQPQHLQPLVDVRT